MEQHLHKVIDNYLKYYILVGGTVHWIHHGQS